MNSGRRLHRTVIEGTRLLEFNSTGLIQNTYPQVIHRWTKSRQFIGKSIDRASPDGDVWIDLTNHVKVWVSLSC